MRIGSLHFVKYYTLASFNDCCRKKNGHCGQRIEYKIVLPFLYKEVLSLIVLYFLYCQLEISKY